MVHDTFAVPATYLDSTMAAAETVAVRWHNRLNLSGFGNLDGGGYAQVLEGINRIVFDRDELAAKGLEIHNRGVVTIPKLGMSFRLDTQDADSGPLVQTWTVIQL